MRLILIAIISLVGTECMKDRVKDPKYAQMLKYKNYIFKIHPLVLLVENGEMSLFPQNKLNMNGVAVLERHQQVILYCSGFYNYLQMDPINQKLNIETDIYPKKFFRSYGFFPGIYPEKKEIDEARCVSPFFLKLDATDKICANGKGTLLTGGFKVDDSFLELYEICFDKNKQLPIYTKHKLLGSKLLNKEEKNNIQGMFVNRVCREVMPLREPGVPYFPNEQAELFRNLFGVTQGNKYLRFRNRYNRLFVTASLTPPGDFYFRPVKTTTYVHENTIPIFSSIAGGNWYLAQVLGRVSAEQSEDKSFDVTSGWFDLLTLPDEKGIEQYIYLDEQLINKKLEHYRPIPKFLYKIFYNPKSFSGLAIVILNNPYVENENSVDFPCSDISEQVMDKDMFSTDPQEGITRICDINDLVQKLDYPEDMNFITKEILKVNIYDDQLFKFIFKPKKIVNNEKEVNRNTSPGKNYNRDQGPSTFIRQNSVQNQSNSTPSRQRSGRNRSGSESRGLGSAQNQPQSSSPNQSNSAPNRQRSGKNRSGSGSRGQGSAQNQSRTTTRGQTFDQNQSGSASRNQNRNKN